VQPCEEPFHLPASTIAAELAAVLYFAFAAAPVRGDQLDALFFVQGLVERVRVEGLVADEAGRKLVREASCQNRLHNPALGRRSAFDSNGKRKTVTRGDSDNL
jgi:hypothetical protein